MKKFHPEVIRVKLTPEQAVLTCCSSTGKTQINFVPGYQCSTFGPDGCGESGPGDNATSS